MNRTLRVAPLPSAEADTARFGLDSCYPPAVWLPAVGPAAYLAWRRLARLAAAGPAIVTVADFAADLGLGSVAGNQSGIARALRRLERFGLLRSVSDELILVAVTVPPVPAAQLHRLPAAVRDRHARLWRAQLHGRGR